MTGCDRIACRPINAAVQATKSPAAMRHFDCENPIRPTTFESSSIARRNMFSEFIPLNRGAISQRCKITVQLLVIGKNFLRTGIGPQGVVDDLPL